MVLRLATIELGLASPQYLVLGLLSPVLLVLIWRRARRNDRMLKARLGWAGSGRNLLLPVARISAVILLALAASSPYIVVYRSVEVSVENVDRVTGMPVMHILLLDESKSMGYTDGALGGSTRMEEARGFIEEYLNSLGDDNVTIILFSANLTTLCEGVEQCLSSIQTVKPGRKYSAIGDALTVAALKASISRIPSVIVLVSDGGWNYGADPRDVARTLGNATPVIFVRVGSDPRAAVLREAAGLGGYKLYNIDEFSLKALKDLVDEVRREARYEALRAAGIATVNVPDRDYTLSTWIGAVALALLTASFRGGP